MLWNLAAFGACTHVTEITTGDLCGSTAAGTASPPTLPETVCLKVAKIKSTD